MLKVIKSRYYEIIAVLSLVAIVINLIARYVLGADSLVYNSPLFLLILVGGLPLMWEIFKEAVKGDFGADLLALIALIVAIYLNEFLASALVILMISSGQALEIYAGRKASFVLEALASRMPSLAHKKDGDKISDIEIAQIKIGDLIEIYPHETCPVDGVVVEGQGQMDESYLTGEPYQISKGSGSFVLSGAVNGESSLTIKATKLPQDSRFSTIVKVMEDAENNKPKMRRLADKIGAVFTPVALIFAILTFAISGSATKFLSVLVVATPCPLLIAIPISIISAISIAAKNGIIVRDPALLEKLPTCSTAIFDKTGTLTIGQPELTEIIVTSDFDEAQILQMSASIERYSRHPLSAAIIEAAKKQSLELLQVEDISEKAGRGLSGKVQGKNIFVTNRDSIMREYSSQIEKLPEMERGLECIIVIDDVIAAIFHFRDIVNNDSHLFVNHLGPHHNFDKVMIVSGDRSSEVEYLASLLEVEEYYSRQTPEQKLAIVKEQNAKAPTLFIGDGINDAPALIEANAGIAFGNYSSVTSQAAGAVIMDNSLAKVDQLIHISESMRAIALQSAIGGMVLSIVGMIFAALGYINPVTGALLQEIIDVAVILNSLRLILRPDVRSDV